MGRRKKQEIYEQEELEYLEDNSFFEDMKKEITGIIIIAIAVLLGISVFYGEDSATLLGPIHTGLSYLFGWFTLLFPIYVIIYTLMVLRDETRSFDFKFIFSCLITITIVGAYPALAVIEDINVAISFGGAFGMGLAWLLYKIGGSFGGYVILAALSALTFILLTKRSFIGLVKKGARTAKEGVLITKESLESRFAHEDEEYGYEIDNGHAVIDNRSTKNYDIRLDEEELDDEYEEDDDEEYEDEDEYAEGDDESCEEIEYEEDGEDDEEYEEEEGEREVRPLTQETPGFFARIRNSLSRDSAKRKRFGRGKEDDAIIEILGTEESPEELAKIIASRNEGIVDIGFWEEGDDSTITMRKKNTSGTSDDDDEEYIDDDEYEEEIDDEDYEAYDEEYEDEDEYETDDYSEEGYEQQEIDIGLHSGKKAKIAREIDVLGNTPMMKPIATTDNEKDESDNYDNKIIKNNPHKPKREIKLIDEDGYEERITIDDEREEEEYVPIDYVYPKINLLSKPPQKKKNDSKVELRKNSKVLEETLKSFGVDAKVTGVTKGPAVTRYELELAVGVKVSKIQNLAEDIALHMASSGVRIAPVPGKAAVGIEIANKEPSSVYMREVLDTEEFESAKSKLAVSLGKGIDGKTIIMDVAKMPHLLIAGATGSGKSVCINTIITSIIYKSSPDEVKLIMVDPKVVELKMYSGIPHLLIPVVTDPKKAASALNWAVAEMLERYKFFADSNVKNLQGYNELMEKKGKRKIPQIVIIVDELADLMMAAGKEVESAICRLAQMARAAGMHLIIATQRPSVDVITGVIKANIPSRIAFAVSSNTDSRTILDAGGAEKLLGKGDMLYFPTGASKPTRIQGAFVSETEVEAVVDFVKAHHEATYSDDIMQKIEKAAEEKSNKDAAPSKEDDNGDDALIYDAVELMNEKKKASISMFQRAFKIGYNRAANLMEALEEKGYVGPDEGTKPRKVYFDAIRDTMDYMD